MYKFDSRGEGVPKSSTGTDPVADIRGVIGVIYPP